MPKECLLGFPAEHHLFVMQRITELLPVNQQSQAKSVLNRFHKQLQADGAISSFNLHKGNKKNGDKKRSGITYNCAKRSAICLDIESRGLKLSFYRACQEPYSGHDYVWFKDKDWSGYIYLTESTFNEALQCARESAKLAGENRVKHQPPTPPSTRINKCQDKISGTTAPKPTKHKAFKSTASVSLNPTPTEPKGCGCIVIILIGAIIIPPIGIAISKLM